MKKMYRVKKFYNVKSKNKYNAIKTTYNNIKYDSKFEAKVAQDLDYKLQLGEIKDVKRQVKISLDIRGYHICNYYIDFVVVHNDNTIEYIEVKGYETPVWKLKWKLFEALYSDEKQETKFTIIKQ